MKLSLNIPVYLPVLSFLLSACAPVSLSLYSPLCLLFCLPACVTFCLSLCACLCLHSYQMAAAVLTAGGESGHERQTGQDNFLHLFSLLMLTNLYFLPPEGRCKGKVGSCLHWLLSEAGNGFCWNFVSFVWHWSKNDWSDSEADSGQDPDSGFKKKHYLKL